MKAQTRIIFLLLAFLLLYIWVIQRMPFLGEWDERYHALVAKNLMDDPLTPRLYPERAVSSSPHGHWVGAYIWLHKQPLATWQMAATMSLLGDGLFGMRFASILMMLLLVFCVWKSVRLFHPRFAFWAALLVGTQPYLLSLLSGRQTLEHNDLAFLAWVAASLCLWLHYLKKPDWKWALAIGAAAGLAMLTKWLAGSLVLFVWGLHFLLSRNFNRKNWLHLALAVGAALAVFLPWQFYAYARWPDLYMEEWRFNGRHFTEVIEGHSGPFWYHFKVWWDEFRIISVLWVISLFFLFIRKKRNTLFITSVLATVSVLIFYGMAATKMPSFTLMVLPLVLLNIGILGLYLKNKIMQWIFGSTILFFISKNVYYDFYQNDVPKEVAENLMNIKDNARWLAEKLPKNSVIFNTGGLHFVEYMFYTEMLFYNGIPSQKDVDELLSKNYHPVVLLKKEENPPDSLQNVEIVRRSF